MRIRELPREDRPREKAIAAGLDSLSDAELLCLLLGSGSPSRPVEQIACDILEKTDRLARLFAISPQQLMEVDGIGPAKALLLAACVQLGKRALERQALRPAVHNPSDLVRWLQAEYGYQPQEHFAVVCLDAKGGILCCQTVFIGTLCQSVVHPREVLRTAVLANAARLIAVHNHPSGNCSPSRADLQATKVLAAACHAAGIPLEDHIIVAAGEWYSFAEHGLLSENSQAQTDRNWEDPAGRTQEAEKESALLS